MRPKILVRRRIMDEVEGYLLTRREIIFAGNTRFIAVSWVRLATKREQAAWRAAAGNQGSSPETVEASRP